MHAPLLPPATLFRTLALALAASCAAPRGLKANVPPATVRLLSARVSAQEVQNTTGNAFALQVGYSPSLRLTAVPLGATLLAEYGMLRDTRHHLFSVPSVQLLIDWAIAEPIELAAGAGVQWWVAPTGPLARPVVTLEARYVPPSPMLRVLRSAFVASSIGASSGAGLQVRAGLEFAFGSMGRSPAKSEPKAQDAAMVCPPPVPCAPCPPCPVAPVPPPVPVLKEAERAPPFALHFPFNVATTDAAGEAYLQRTAAALVAHSSSFHHVDVVGHASARGTLAHNLTVSLRRAHNVAQALINAGVNEHQLTVHGLGETAPIPNLDRDDPAQQRVVLILVGADPKGPLFSDTDLTFAPSEGNHP